MGIFETYTSEAVSDRTGETYTITRLADGVTWLCTCPGFPRVKRPPHHCKHIKAVYATNPPLVCKVIHDITVTFYDNVTGTVQPYSYKGQDTQAAGITIAKVVNKALEHGYTRTDNGERAGYTRYYRQSDKRAITISVVVTHTSQEFASLEDWQAHITESNNLAG